MNPLLDQFHIEAREFLQGIGEKLMQLEHAPDDTALMNDLFRLVHTLKGTSGLFDFPEMMRVLHAGEDLMDGVRNGRVNYTQNLADHLLDAMDFVGQLCDDSEAGRRIDASCASKAVRLAEALRALIPAESNTNAEQVIAPANEIAKIAAEAPALDAIPEEIRILAQQRSEEGAALHWIAYAPIEECFYQGDDPFYRSRQTPDIVWGRIMARQSWPQLAELDAYCCLLDFQMLSAAPRAELDEHFRYVPDQVCITPIVFPLPPTLTVVSNESSAADEVRESILASQRLILQLDDQPSWLVGRLKAVANVLIRCNQALGDIDAHAEISAALNTSLANGNGLALLAWLDAQGSRPAIVKTEVKPLTLSPSQSLEQSVPTEHVAPGAAISGPKSLKVDQTKIDRLMNLIGEMVVSKNSLPYLAQRAEDQFGVRELAREIKAQYAVINRIAEEMQDAIMQVRMLPVSFVFQRFPRLVRDISRKLGKQVELVLEGEDTEADKNIIESLADPLIHIVRNSLDHGLETPEVRRARGKPESGTLTIRAAQEGDRVLIDIIDDGNGIDPNIIKRKAWEKGVIDEAILERISDRDAINLVFAAGFSTAEVVSDLSGRGVGMDVVRNAVEKVNGIIVLESETGKGTRIRISLPLSIAVTPVMIVESDHQLFGVPMDHVVETVRVARSAIHTIKRTQTTALRGRIVPLKSLNALLGLPVAPVINDDDEIAVLVARAGSEVIGLLVDDFRETVSVIQKPLTGVLAGLPIYSGSALMGDGSVLMVLNLKELV